jgi:O-antigen/teichoic acid export membrane protein
MFIPTNRIWRGLKNASYLTIAHVISVVINFFGFVYIAILLGPSNYGIYITVVAFVGLFDILTFRGLNKVVLREGAKDLSQMSEYLEKASGIKNFFTLIAIISCIICSFFTPYSTLEKIFIIFFSITLIYRSFEGFLGIIYQAAEKMQYNSALTILNRILFVPLSILVLIMGFGVTGLFVIAIFSQFFTLFLNFKLTKRFLSFKFFSKIKWDKSILKPALIFSIISFTVLLTSKIDIVMISWLGTSKDVGIYGVAYQITHSGAEIKNLVSVAFFPIFVKIFHNKIVRWKKLLKYAFFIGLILLILSTVVSILSPKVIPLIFGEEYFESGIILSVLIFYLAFIFLNIPFTNTLQATHNEIHFLKICWIAPCLNIGLNYLFFKIFGLIGIAYSTLIVQIVAIPITIFVTYRVLKKQGKII